MRLLGALEVTSDGRLFEVSGTKQRAVLAMLALRAGSAVSVSRIIEGIWGEDAPESVTASIRVYVSHWRRAFIEADCHAEITHGPGGYVLKIEPDQVDAARFDRFVVVGRAAMAEQRYGVAVHAFREAMGLFRGDALDGDAAESGLSG